MEKLNKNYVLGTAAGVAGTGLLGYSGYRIKKYIDARNEFRKPVKLNASAGPSVSVYKGYRPGFEQADTFEQAPEISVCGADCYENYMYLTCFEPFKVESSTLYLAEQIATYLGVQTKYKFNAKYTQTIVNVHGRKLYVSSTLDPSSEFSSKSPVEPLDLISEPNLVWVLAVFANTVTDPAQRVTLENFCKMLLDDPEYTLLAYYSWVKDLDKFQGYLSQELQVPDYRTDVNAVVNPLVLVQRRYNVYFISSPVSSVYSSLTNAVTSVSLDPKVRYIFFSKFVDICKSFFRCSDSILYPYRQLYNGRASFFNDLEIYSKIVAHTRGLSDRDVENYLKQVTDLRLARYNWNKETVFYSYQIGQTPFKVPFKDIRENKVDRFYISTVLLFLWTHSTGKTVETPDSVIVPKEKVTNALEYGKHAYPYLFLHETWFYFRPETLYLILGLAKLEIDLDLFKAIHSEMSVFFKSDSDIDALGTQTVVDAIFYLNDKRVWPMEAILYGKIVKPEFKSKTPSQLWNTALGLHKSYCGNLTTECVNMPVQRNAYKSLLDPKRPALDQFGQ